MVAIAGLSAMVWVEANLSRVAALTDYPDRPPPGSGTNWLLVGSDSRAGLTVDEQASLSTGGDTGNGRTDTVLLVHIPGLLSGLPAVVVSIPRDSYVAIPGWGMDKLNVAFAEGGPALLTRTVEQTTGVRLDHYAEVGFGGFGAVVDALGGVRMCLPESISDPLAGIDLPAGCQTLRGAAALGYVRTRATPRADLDRMVHQREFVSAMLDQAASPAVWANPWRWYTVPRALAGSVVVDERTHVWNLLRLGWAVHGRPLTMTVPVGEFTANESGDVVIWDSEAATALFGALRTDTAVPQQVLDAQP